ncbi:hypothetical protein J2D73_19155 [Acetobacter sacchari]|uniref:Uncharacterized protein n=1 Tax=Acetobacter sacchari TaxID=2661687 RepID=A0ABS3M176_9PROT|nr:hypothetical protein [Acetobacter sacchari]MBO1361904.1 hypothetical protein [Acetobacter sacchari]
MVFLNEKVREKEAQLAAVTAERDAARERSAALAKQYAVGFAGISSKLAGAEAMRAAHELIEKASRKDTWEAVSSSLNLQRYLGMQQQDATKRSPDGHAQAL